MITFTKREGSDEMDPQASASHTRASESLGERSGLEQGSGVS
jgi:hypothetical protein